jgi:outer membrane protein
MWWSCLALVLLLSGPGWAQESAPAEAKAEARPAPPEVVTIEDAYWMALKTHEQIRIAEQELEKARLQPLKAWTLITPRARFLGSYTRYSRSINIAGMPTGGGPGALGVTVPTVFPLNLYQGDFQVVQPIFDRTFITRREAAGNTIDSSRYTLRRTAKEILFRVASAYYEVLKAQSLVEVARQTLGLANDSLRVAKARFQVGEETKTAVLRAEVDVARGERDLTQSVNNLEIQLAVLANLIDREPTFEVVAPAPVEPVSEPLHIYQDLALKYRDDLRVQEDNLQLAKYDRDLVREELFPSANATFTYTRVTPQTIIALDDFWNLVVALNVPIFEGGLTYVNLAEAGKSIRQAELQVENLKKQIQIEIKDAYLRVRTLASTLATLEKQAELAAENYDIVFKQFKVGVATSLDVTDALTALTSARTDLANERYNYQVAILNLQRVSGTFALDYTASLGPEADGFCLGLF